MAISAKDVAALRTKTGCGILECKKALEAANGDFDEAIKVLREKGLSVAAKKADRIASEGIVDIMTNEAGNVAAMIEVNAETDFVSKNANFQEFVKSLLQTLLNERPADIATFMACKFDNDFTVETKLKDMIFTIGENMSIRRFVIAEGTMSTYIHGKGSTGVIITFDADEVAKNNSGFSEFSKNIALQVAAMPCLYLNKEAVPASHIEEEKQILMTQIKNDESNATKPDSIIEKMVMGKIGKFYEKNCLNEQIYVKDDSMTIGKYVAATAKEFGGNITLTGFYTFEKGEGLQKKEENFADEIAKMVNN